MNYKVIVNDQVMDVLGADAVLVMDGKYGLIRCEASEATGVVGSDGDTVYSIAGTSGLRGSYPVARVVDIDDDEADRLKTLLGLGGIVAPDGGTEWPHEPPEEKPEEIPDPDLEAVRARKLALLSDMCKQSIEAGVDVPLSDGSVKHFSLTVEDQLNIASMVTLIQQGHTIIPYHADGELCRFFSAEDMQRIADAATRLKSFHVTYFNSLRHWIDSMQTVAEIGAVEYGMDIPEEHCSDVLLEMLTA